MNYQALARFIAYLLAVGLGIFMTVWGVTHDDAATVTSGIALVTTGGIAGANTPVRPARHAAEEGEAS